MYAMSSGNTETTENTEITEGTEKLVTEIYEKELSYKIIGCAIQVHKSLGSGYMEKLYERALILELTARGLSAKSQFPIRVSYRGEIIGDYKADIVVEDKIILELKACSMIIPVHVSQLIQYLHATGMRCGYVINFGSSKVLEYARRVV